MRLSHGLSRYGLVAGFLLIPAMALAQEAVSPDTGIAIPALLSRWAHILSAIVMLGGSIFIRFVLMPSVTEAFGPEGHQKLRPVLMKRWKKYVHGSILLFLVSGFYNFVLQVPLHRGDGLYHALFGIKFVLAMAVFASISMLISTREKPNKLRENAALWMAITVTLAVIVVLIAGVMKLS